MSWWSRIFGGASSQGKSGSASHAEKDNRGTQHATLGQASAYWIARQTMVKKDPFTMYVFGAEKDGRDALLELPCMHLASDTGKLICTETLIYGCYSREDGKWEALVCGDDLTRGLWEAARTSFEKHGGVKKNELEPARTAPAPKAPAQPDVKKVRFVREDRTQKMGSVMTYRIHKGPDAATAKAFLAQNPVTRPLYYLVVETPEGNYCRDKDGIYKE